MRTTLIIVLLLTASATSAQEKLKSPVSDLQDDVNLFLGSQKHLFKSTQAVVVAYEKSKSACDNQANEKQELTLQLLSVQAELAKALDAR